MDNNNQSEIILLKDKEWSLIDGELCLITNFTPFMGSAVKDGVVISPDTSTPYASVEVKCKKAKKITGFITHKIDFSNLWAAFKERGFDKEKEEILIYWTAKRYKYKFYQAISNFLLAILGGTPMPKLIVMICPKDTYKSCESYPDGFRLSADEKILVFVHGLMSIKWWVPDVMK